MKNEKNEKILIKFMLNYYGMNKCRYFIAVFRQSF